MTTFVKKRKTNYINNKDFHKAFLDYVGAPKETRKMSDYMGRCIMQICTRIGHRPNFSRYTYRDEMIADAIENCVYAVPHFDPIRFNNPFGYFSRVAWRAFIRRIGTEKKQNYIKYKNLQALFTDEEMAGISHAISGGEGTGHGLNEASSHVIQTFEDKLTEIKKKNKVGVLAFAEDVRDETGEPKLGSQVGTRNTRSGPTLF